MKKALIIGINSGDGFYLIQLLLKKNYEVYIWGNIDSEIFSAFCKLLDKTIENIGHRLYKYDSKYAPDISKIILEIGPDEIYILVEDIDVNCKTQQNCAITITTIDVLRIVKCFPILHSIQIFQASSLNLYGIIIG